MQEIDNQELHTLRDEIDSVQGRYSHLLTITVVVMLVITAGMVLRIFPRLLWDLGNRELERLYIPQLLCGLATLVALLSWYVLEQRRFLRKTQQQLITELVRRETAERLAVIDPLTETYNRRFIMRAIASEAARVERQNSKCAFLMIDVNGFKQANDSLGHPTGDRILKELALLLQSTLRTSDVISRYGGDEFLVLLVDSDDTMAQGAVKRVQHAVDQWNQKRPIEGYNMSISCGSAVYRRGGDRTAVLAAADQAMYQNKSMLGPQLVAAAGR